MYSTLAIQTEGKKELGDLDLLPRSETHEERVIEQMGLKGERL